MSEPAYKGEKNGMQIYAYRPASRDMTPELEQMERSRDFWEKRARQLEAIRREEFHERVEARMAYIERKEREADERKRKFKSDTLPMLFGKALLLLIVALWLSRVFWN